MFDAFPYDEWSTEVAEFWTFGGESSAGTYVITVLGIVVMFTALIGFVRLEKTKLERQATMLKAAGTLDRPTVVSSE